MSNIPEPQVVREDILNKFSIKVIRGDVTKVGTGAIVCPTNAYLAENSGLTSFIREVAGSRVLYELKTAYSDPLNPGEIIITSAGNLPANYVFHACIPSLSQAFDSSQLLRIFILKVLEKCEEIRSGAILIPCLPTATYGYSPSECASEYWNTVCEYLSTNSETVIKEVKFVTLDKEATDLFIQQAEKRFGIKEKKNSFFSLFQKKKQPIKKPDIELQ